MYILRMKFLAICFEQEFCEFIQEILKQVTQNQQKAQGGNWFYSAFESNTSRD